MKQLNKEILQNAIDYLPEIDPEPYFWNKIESFLDFGERISKTIPSLPSYEPGKSLWNNILIKLESRNRKIISLNKVAKYTLATAAAFLILICTWQLLLPRHKEVYISYSIEHKILTDSLPGPAKTEQDSENYIRLSCSREPDRCESPEISSLKYELENLNRQYIILNAEAEHYGNDENIMKAYAKIEVTKSRVLRELISKLKS